MSHLHQRPASLPARRDPALDSLAILLVFLFRARRRLRAHSLPLRAFGYLNEAGWLGVELFFVLSGFLITGNLADSAGLPPPPAELYGRRALRILPLCFATLLVAGSAA